MRAMACFCEPVVFTFVNPWRDPKYRFGNTHWPVSLIMHAFKLTVCKWWNPTVCTLCARMRPYIMHASLSVIRTISEALRLRTTTALCTPLVRIAAPRLFARLRAVLAGLRRGQAMHRARPIACVRVCACVWYVCYAVLCCSMICMWCYDISGYLWNVWYGSVMIHHVMLYVCVCVSRLPAPSPWPVVASPGRRPPWPKTPPNDIRFTTYKLSEIELLIGADRWVCVLTID